MGEPVKREGIVARPGVHRRRDGSEEVVTKEELQRAIRFQNRIPLIVGPHPAGGYASPTDFVGTVTPYWDDAHNLLAGKFWFFDEEWERIPEEIRKRILSGELVKLSAGYEVGKVENGHQVGRKWDHLALGVDNPMHPDVGVNVRVEEEFPENFRTEQEAEIGSEKKAEQRPPEKAPVQQTMTFTKEQFDQLLAAIRPYPQPQAPHPAEEKLERAVAVVEQPKQAETVVVPTPPQPKPQVEPARTIPKDTSAPGEPEHDGLFKRGRTFGVPIAGDKTKKK